MKLFLKILAVIIVILAASIILLPVFFKGQIIDLAKKEINRNVNAKVDFKDMDVSLIKNFPNFSLSIHGLTIVGKDVFEGDTMANVKDIGIVLDLMSVLRGDQYEVNRISVSSPSIRIKINEVGQANYDISLSSESNESTTAPDEETAFNISLKHFQISNANIVYEDMEAGIYLSINNLNNSLSGDFTQDMTNIRTTTEIERLDYKMDGVNYLNKARLNYQAQIKADLKNSIFTLGKNELKLNDLRLNFDGSVSMIEEGTNLVLTFNAPANQFKSFLSLIPAIYTNDFKDVKADGKVAIDGSVKGIYNENKLPAFVINLAVDNGTFSYPDLPGSVSDIQILTKVSNRGGDADNTIIDVSQFSMKLGENPFIASLLVKTPVSDPDIDAKIKGTIDLASLKNYYPVEEEVSGKFIADVTVKGKMSSIEKEEYDKFLALGSLLVQNLSYETEELNKTVQISTAQLNFSPQYLDLVSFKMNIGKSDLSANGKVTNYMGYIFKGSDLKGKLTTSSNYFNMDELIEKPETENTETGETPSGDTKKTPSEESSVILVPDKIDFVMTSTFDKLIYDGIEMSKVKGEVKIKEKVLSLKNLQMNVVQGTMIVSGNYSTKNPEEPKVNLNFQLKDLNIPAAYNSFAVMRKYLPIAKKTTGFFNAKFTLSTVLDKEMMPVYNTMNGGGELSTTKITVNDLNTLLQISEALQFTKIKNLELDKTLVNFKFIDGKMAVNPFDIKYKNITANIGGWTAFDQSIGYVMNLNIPREELGASANQMMEGLMAEAKKLGVSFTLPDNIEFDVLVGGTLSKPTVKTGLKNGGNDLLEKAKQEVIKELSKEAREKAQQLLDEADKQAKALIAEAEKQAKYLKENADKAIVQLNKETDKQADALMAEAKKQGFVAELAAKEAIKQLRKEADKQVQTLRTDADKQADALVATAKKTAADIKKEAQKQADTLLKQ